MTLKMKERSAGLVLFREGGGTREYLLLLYPHSKVYWGFCKGHVEKGESDEVAALREVIEETGLSQVALVVGFSATIRYFMVFENHQVSKEVTFFLGKVDGDFQGRVSSEHLDLCWLPYPLALVRLKYKKDKDVLVRAEKFLREM